MESVGDHLLPIGADFVSNCPNLAVYLLASVLRHSDHEAAVVDLAAKGTHKITGWLPAIREADLICISCTSLNWPAILSVIRQIRTEGVDVPIVLGGIHPTMFPEYILQAYPAVTFIIRGEGEKALLALCGAIEEQTNYADVPNLSWRDADGQILHNRMAPLLTVDELAALPPPAYDLLPPGIFPVLSMQSSRGCPFNCCFCSTQFRRSYRAIPPAAFVDVLERTLAIGSDRVTEPGVVMLVDDEWSINRKRSIEILRELSRRGIAIKLIYDSRANDLLDEDFVTAVAPFTKRFLVGAECGYDEGLAMVGKGTTTERLERAAYILHKHDLAGSAEFSFILGLPWEKKEDVLKTVRFATKLVSQYGINVLLQWYCQIPGSLLWDERTAKEAVSPRPCMINSDFSAISGSF